MATKYYLKLYHEMLDDWKVLSLPDGLKWRFVQCLLVAGELNQDGWLPEIRQFAARIRPMNHDDLTADLSRLASAELVELRIDSDGCERWFIPKFEKRQARSKNAERQAAWRGRQKEKKEAKKRNIDIDTTKIRIDTSNVTRNVTSNADDGGFALVFTEYENEIGQLTPIISGQIEAAVDEFGANWLVDAIAIAADNNVRKWSYINGILKRWRVDGRDNGAKKKTKETEHLAGTW